jgi:spermidine/putrescine-binding protein
MLLTASGSIAAAAGLGALAGCESSTEERRVSFLNWQDYIAPNVLRDFTSRTGLAVGYETYESNDALRRRLAAADVRRRAGRRTTTFDLVVPSDNLFRQLRAADGLRPLDRDIVTEGLLGNLDPAFRSFDADPGNRYAVPWASGTTGIAYDTSVIKEPPTWEVFLDARYSGRMSLLAETREAFAAAMFSLGEDPNTTDPAVVRRAEAQLTTMRAHTAFNASTYLDDLAERRLVAAQGFSTDVLQARRRNPDLAFVIPDAGGTRWVDLLCVPSAAPNPEGANRFIAFALDPAVAAANAAANLVDTGNRAARSQLPRDVLENPVVYPPAEVLARLRFLEDLGEDEALYDEAWKRLTG